MENNFEIKEDKLINLKKDDNNEKYFDKKQDKEEKYIII